MFLGIIKYPFAQNRGVLAPSFSLFVTIGIEDLEALGIEAGANDYGARRPRLLKIVRAAD